VTSSYWSRDWYLEFSNQLAANITALDDAIGLILVGSTSDTHRVDEWSDHDFFVVTVEGSGEGLRQDLSWLPFNDRIAWATRETAHGLKVVYEFGHVLEFAVFNDSELELAKVNAATVAVDKANIQARVAALRTASEPTPADWNAELELLLTHILIGVGRARRGETLIAGQHTRSYLLGHALGLLGHWIPAEADTEGSVDNLNRFRRFEQRHPLLAREIETALQADVETGASQILELLARTDPNPGDAKKFALVRARLGW
jgi:hypothetical protein